MSSRRRPFRTDLDEQVIDPFVFVSMLRGLATARDVAEINITAGTALVEMGLEPPAEFDASYEAHD